MKTLKAGNLLVVKDFNSVVLVLLCYCILPLTVTPLPVFGVKVMAVLGPAMWPMV